MSLRENISNSGQFDADPKADGKGKKFDTCGDWEKAMPLEWQKSLRTTILDQAVENYEKERNGRTSTKEEKDEDYIKAEELMYQTYSPDKD
jgi:hypothetical protein